MDQVLLASIHDDLDYIHRECWNRQTKLNTDYLEWFRSADSPYGLAFVDDKRHQSFCWQERKIAISRHGVAQDLARHFIGDPASLVEGRLPMWGAQR